jgi:beta-lactamase class C
LLFFSGISFALEEKLQNFINQIEIQTPSLQGGVIAIIYKGEVIYKSAFGNKKDIAEPITYDTLFPVGSLSKPITLVAIALMADHGLISLDEKFKLPFFKNSINLTEVLSHTTSYNLSGNLQIEQGISRAKLLDNLKKLKPQCTAKKCYFYSNTIYSLVEEILNKKKLTLQDAIKHLNIKAVQILPLDPKADLAYPHSASKRSLPFPPFYPKTVPASAGAFISLNGAIDFFKLSFGYRPDLISKKALERLYTPITVNHDLKKWAFAFPNRIDNLKSYYGLGWRILENNIDQDKKLIFHGGYINGIRSFMGFIPSYELGIIILINQDSSFPLKTGIKFWNEFE